MLLGPSTLALFAIFSLALAPCLPAQETGGLDPALLGDLRARSIGPAGMSGRVAAVASIPGDPRSVLVGSASGGLFASTDGGVTFRPIFDEQDCASIGSIAIDPSTPEVIWVGTGEGNLRNSASVGRGVYRTRDFGRTWEKLGLEHTEHIRRIVLRPDDGDVAFVAAMGTAWGENEERGLFRTKDGGKTFEKVLFVDPKTGCADVAMDPRNPNKLFAAMWQFRREPHTFASGGPGSGLYRSLDGGDHWQRLDAHDGMPEGDLGRIGISISRSDPDVVYALVEARTSALLRSDDGGFTFRTVNRESGIATRPFYFGEIRVDPRDPNRIYNLAVTIQVSEDGGKTFRSLVGWDAAHPDHHAMWIDPEDGNRILIGTDGGVYESRDRGETWRFCSNLPLAQFYHIAVDDDFPYHVYGGLQDNGSWRGPSDVFENGGIRNLHWDEVCFGDGFATLPDPDDSMQGYAMSQGGELIRWNLRTGEHRSIRPPSPEGIDLRFNWNAAIAQDPFDPKAIYYGSQFVHYSPDRGENWEIRSPDLTTDNPAWQKQSEAGGLSVDVTGAENHCTILSISPSPLDRRVIWVGTDDGRLQVTSDGGTSWRSVESRIPGLLANTWCPHVEASPHDSKTAFAVFDDHRRGNWSPHVYRTDDLGLTWTSLATEDLDGYCLAILQDPVDPDLLFLGTEFGLWFTIDAGSKWHRFRNGLPTTSVMALAIQPRERDLVIGTHGRAAFIVDDITPLRQWSAEIAKEKLHLFPIPDAFELGIRQTPASRFPGQDEFRGETKRRGAILTVWTGAEDLPHPDPKVERRRKAKGEQSGKPNEETLSEAGHGKDGAGNEHEEPKDQVAVEISTAEGRVVRRFRHRVHRGLNRSSWNFETDGGPRPSRELQEPPELPPGTGGRALPGLYRVQVSFRGEKRTAEVRVLPDPREPFDEKAARAKVALRDRAAAIRKRAFEATQRLARAGKEIQLARQRLAIDPKPKRGEDPLREARAAVDACGKEFDELSLRLFGPAKPPQGYARDESLLADLGRELSSLTSSFTAPNSTETLGVDRAGEVADAIERDVREFLTGPLADLRAALQGTGLDFLPRVPEPAHGRRSRERDR
ncbi:MAG: hypothetical protein Fur0037_17360 [Planctomycetota bacterium]